LDWPSAERRAGLEPKHGKGWHSLRRKFASGLMGPAAQVLYDLGGRKEAQTVLRYNQHTAKVQLRKTLGSGRRKGFAPEAGDGNQMRETSRKNSVSYTEVVGSQIMRTYSRVR